MASVSKKDIPVEAAFFPEFWELVKKFYIPEDNPEFWEAVHTAVMEQSKKYNSKLAAKMLVAYMEYLQEQHREQTGKPYIQRGN